MLDRIKVTGLTNTALRPSLGGITIGCFELLNFRLGGFTAAHVEEGEAGV